MSKILTVLRNHLAPAPREETAHEAWDRLLRNATSAHERAEIDAIFVRELGVNA